MTSTDSCLGCAGQEDDSAIHHIAEMVVASVRREYPPGTLARRDAHPKHHAVLRATFTVADDVPPELRYGVFAASASYPAWIRFSNGSPSPQPDRRRDQRGMAIKLLQVPGEKMLASERDALTQDFILSSSPRFFIRSVSDYVDFTRAATRKPSFRVLSYFFRGAPWRWRIHELRALVASLQRTDDVLSLRYWSQTPYRLGPHVVKYSARPVGRGTAGGPVRPGSSPDFLRETMAVRLATEPAAFEFLVQRRTDPASMPIEDATIEWDEARAPFARVATITIPVQRFESEAQMRLAEQISYTPWHTLPEHEPLGGINRTRRVVYEAVSRVRHELNGTARKEPVSLEVDI
jgi:hypothetical protein